MVSSNAALTALRRWLAILNPPHVQLRAAPELDPRPFQVGILEGARTSHYFALLPRCDLGSS